MKGFLHKTEQGWVVKHSRLNDDGESIGFGYYEQLPLHPDEPLLLHKQSRNNKIWEGKEVEFEIVDFTYYVNNTPFSFKCAKLINQVPDVKMVEDEIIDWIDNEILLNEQYKDSPRLKEGATMVKVHIQSLKQHKKD